MLSFLKLLLVKGGDQQRQSFQTAGASVIGGGGGPGGGGCTANFSNSNLNGSLNSGPSVHSVSGNANNSV